MRGDTFKIECENECEIKSVIKSLNRKHLGAMQTGIESFVALWSPLLGEMIVRSAAGFPFNTEDVQILGIKIIRL